MVAVLKRKKSKSSLDVRPGVAQKGPWLVNGHGDFGGRLRGIGKGPELFGPLRPCAVTVKHPADQAVEYILRVLGFGYNNSLVVIRVNHFFPPRSLDKSTSTR